VIGLGKIQSDASMIDFRGVQAGRSKIEHGWSEPLVKIKRRAKITLGGHPKIKKS
jgi:hypothetical protein